MKDPKFYVGVVIGFSMSVVLLSIGFIVVPAHASPTIGSNDIEDDAIISQKIKDGEVKTPDLANGAVTKEKLSPSAIKLVAVERHATFTTTPPSHAVAAIHKCNAGETATGGGYWHGDVNKGTVAFVSRPTPEADGWTVFVWNTDGMAHQFTVYVVCTHLELGP